MAEALYRKYRPQVFSDVVGQDHIEQTLRNAIAQDKVSHAYLFCGPRGTGKTTTARLLAKALLCETGPTAQPDGTCQDCLMIANGEHPDVYELDAASRTGVENVREEIIGRVQFAPTRGSYKVYIIDEVHMLSTAAFNALLKTLEEPPSHVVFILCTTDPQKVPETIHSRCQRFDFRRISLEYLVGRLGAVCESEGVAFEGQALELIAHRAEGGMRNALTALEQVIAFGGGTVTMKAAEDVLGSLDSSDLAEIMSFIGRRDVAGCFQWVARYAETGSDLAQFTRDLAEHTRNLYIMALGGVDIPLDVNDALRGQMKEQLAWFGPDRLARMMGVLGDLTVELKTSTNPRLSFEIACTRLVRPDSDLTLEALAERIEALESGYAAVGGMPVAGGMPAAYRGEALTAEQPAAQVSPSRQEQPAAQVSPSRQAESAQQGASPEASREAASPQMQPAAEQRQSTVVATTQDDVPEPVPAGNLEATLGNPAALQRAWGSAITLLRREKPAYAVLLMNAKAIYDADKNMLLVDFPKDAAFAYKAVQKPEVTEELDKALQAVLNARVAFSYVQSATGQSARAPQAQVQTRHDDGEGQRVNNQAQQFQAQRQAHEQAAQQREAARLQAQRQHESMEQPRPQQEQRASQQSQSQQEPRISQHTQQRRAAAQAQAQAQVQSAPEPDYDRVPLDAYDNMGFSEADNRDDVPPWEPLPQAQPATQAKRQPARSQEPVVQYRQAASGPADQQAAASQGRSQQAASSAGQVRERIPMGGGSSSPQAAEPTPKQEPVAVVQQAATQAAADPGDESPEKMGAMLSQVFGEAIRFKDEPIR